MVGGSRRRRLEKRFIIIDAALDGPGGHYLDYDRRILDAARARGYRTILATRATLAEAEARAHTVVPVLSDGYWDNYIAVAGDFAPLVEEAAGLAAKVRAKLGLNPAGRG